MDDVGPLITIDVEALGAVLTDDANTRAAVSTLAASCAVSRAFHCNFPPMSRSMALHPTTMACGSTSIASTISTAFVRSEVRGSGRRGSVTVNRPSSDTLRR
jgi:hypothetical protein